MPKTCYVLTSTFSRSCIDFGRSWGRLGLQVGAKLAILHSQDPPRSLQNPVFWEHVSKMLPKRLQSGSKRGPKEGPEVDFSRMFDRFGSPFSLFLPVRIYSLNPNSRYERHLKSTYVLLECRHDLKILYSVDFKPHVQGRW